MRLLFVTNFLAVGGVETNLVSIASELARRGHTVMLAWRADRILLISREIEAAVRRLGIAPSRLLAADVVGIDLSRFRAGPEDASAIRAELSIEPQARVVTTIGALHERKRHDLFID